MLCYVRLLVECNGRQTGVLLLYTTCNYAGLVIFEQGGLLFDYIRLRPHFEGFNDTNRLSFVYLVSHVVGDFGLCKGVCGVLQLLQ